MARFTRETAAINATKAQEARRQRKLAAENTPATPQPAAQLAAHVAIEERLACAREHVDLLSRRLTEALRNPKTQAIDIDRLQKSLASAREDERRYAGRPLPPTLKSTQIKPAPRQSTFTEPT
ncbi:MAG TPA: hypothetical protein VMZ30_21820 [Pyrinomonadaceae bacterium]|nr:hypothetical protein [Pyrinomonadaceae bacterium]